MEAIIALLAIYMLLGLSLVEHSGYGGWLVVIAFIIYMSMFIRCLGLTENVASKSLCSHLYSIYYYIRKLLSNKERVGNKGGEESE